jgi:hypothetical protein
MKRILFIMLLFAASAIVTTGIDRTGTAQAMQGVQVNFSFFYSSLAQHGEWIEADPGFYVWRPYHVSRGWRPYMHGRWVWTSYGWYWVSYEPFGWAVFHYGRWYYDDFYGWVWVPGYEWGPAWVEWRYNDDYIGWAPLPPYATFSMSVGIRFTRVWRAPVHYWTFIPCRYIVHHRIVDHVVPVERSRRLFGSTRSSARYVVDNGRVVNAGIDVGFVERRAKTRVERVDIIETRERGVERMKREDGRERIEIYRPHRDDIERSSSTRIDARRGERRLSLDRESIEEGSTRRGTGREGTSTPEPRRDGEIYRTPETREGDVRRAPEPSRRREPEIQREGERKRESEPERKHEPQIQRQPEVKRAPEPERRRETDVDMENRDTKTRGESPPREQERSRPSRSERPR